MNPESIQYIPGLPAGSIRQGSLALIDQHLEQTIKHLITCCPIGKEHADKCFRKMNLTIWMIQTKESESTVNILLEGQSPLFSKIGSILLKISLNGIMWMMQDELDIPPGSLKAMDVMMEIC